MAKAKEREPQRPCEFTRVGRAVISHWERTNRDGEAFKTFSVSEYRTGPEGEAQYGQSFTVRTLLDLGVAALVTAIKEQVVSELRNGNAEPGSSSFRGDDEPASQGD